MCVLCIEIKSYRLVLNNIMKEFSIKVMLEMLTAQFVQSENREVLRRSAQGSDPVSSVEPFVGFYPVHSQHFEFQS